MGVSPVRMENVFRSHGKRHPVRMGNDTGLVPKSLPGTHGRNPVRRGTWRVSPGHLGYISDVRMTPKP